MSKKTSYLLGILLTIVIGTILYWYLCCCCCSNKEGCTKKAGEEKTIVEEPNVREATLNPFNFKDGDFSVNMNDNFNFKGSDYRYVEPVSEDFKNSVAKIKAYLDENPNKRFNITGLYSNDEKNNSAFPNLGLARANTVKNYLVSQGISSRLINTYGELKDGLTPDENNIYFGPVNYSAKTLVAGDTADADALKEACDAIRANPLVLYFKTGEASINLTAEQRQKIADISRCVDKLGVKVQVVGHTDNTGDAANNIVLGQNRADFAKSYLVRNGILSDTIEATSQGPNEPIADNATEEGRAKNRRTVVTIN